jgi:hypothetical protein
MRFAAPHGSWLILSTALTLTTLAGCGGGDDESAANVEAPRVDTAAASTATGTVAATTSGTRSVSLAWAAPTQYEDGSPFVDLAGYRIWYGGSPGNYSRLVEIAPGTTAHNIRDLAATTYYFSITAYNHEGVESTLSNEVAIRLN